MKFLFFFLFFLISTATLAQKMPDIGLYRVRINDTDKTILAQVSAFSDQPQARPALYYYWYASNMIHELQGGYSGKLLDGAYMEFYLNKNVKQQGIFRQGLKTGVWKDWDPDGVLRKSVTWSDGLKSGKFTVFKADGTLEQSGCYRHNLLDGKLMDYFSADSVHLTQYKKGKIVPLKSGSLFERLNPFKKKVKASR